MFRPLRTYAGHRRTHCLYESLMEFQFAAPWKFVTSPACCAMRYSAGAFWKAAVQEIPSYKDRIPQCQRLWTHRRSHARCCTIVSGQQTVCFINHNDISMLRAPPSRCCFVHAHMGWSLPPQRTLWLSSLSRDTPRRLQHQHCSRLQHSSRHAVPVCGAAADQSYSTDAAAAAVHRDTGPARRYQDWTVYKGKSALCIKVPSSCLWLASPSEPQGPLLSAIAGKTGIPPCSTSWLRSVVEGSAAACAEGDFVEASSVGSEKGQGLKELVKLRALSTATDYSVAAGTHGTLD